jgi:acyl carrier protein
MREKIRGVLRDMLPIETDRPILDTDNIEDDLGADSLDRVEIIMVLEETFAIVIEDLPASKIMTVADYDSVVEEALKKSPTKESQ